MIFWGIVLGLATAGFQNLGYGAVRKAVQAGESPLALLIHSQLIMGAFALASSLVLWALWGLPHGAKWILPLILTVLGSGGGQFFLFNAEKAMPPAKVSALMGLRVVMLALVSEVFFHAHFGAVRWAGIACAALSAPALNWEGGQFHLGGMRAFGAALLCYCVSDLSIAHLIRGTGFAGFLPGVLWSVVLVSLLSSLISAVLSCFACGVRGGQKALPFALAWFVKQMMLYGCYAMIGAVHGNVVLSLRGIIALAAAFRRSRKHPESAVPGKVWLQRLGATVLMTAAVILYSLGSVKRYLPVGDGGGETPLIAAPYVKQS